MQPSFYEQYAVNWISGDRRQREIEASLYKVQNFIPLAEGIYPKRILDFGCGTGDVLNLLSKHFRTNDVIGVDISSTMIESAKRRYPNFEFIQGGVEKVKNLQIDLITFFDVLEHIEDIPTILNASKSVANFIGIKIPLEKTRIIHILNTLHLKDQKSRLYESEGHLYEFNRKVFETILKDAGLQTINAKTNFEPEFNPYMMKRMKSKTGFLARLKYYSYIALSRVPVEISRPLISAISGTNFFALCKC